MKEPTDDHCRFIYNLFLPNTGKSTNRDASNSNQINVINLLYEVTVSQAYSIYV